MACWICITAGDIVNGPWVTQAPLAHVVPGQPEPALWWLLESLTIHTLIRNVDGCSFYSVSSFQRLCWCGRLIALSAEQLGDGGRRWRAYRSTRAPKTRRPPDKSRWGSAWWGFTWGMRECWEINRTTVNGLVAGGRRRRHRRGRGADLVSLLKKGVKVSFLASGSLFFFPF